MTKKVAVLLSTYNGAQYLEEYLDSLASQDRQDITLFVRDDGSSDETLQILKKHRENSRLTLHLLDSDAHLGAAQSFLRLLGDAGDSFETYAFGDQDDIWLPDKLTRAVNKLATIPWKVPGLYCSRLEYVDETARPLKWSNIPRRIGFGNAVVENIATGCSTVINQSARALILSRLPNAPIMHDWWCYLVVSCFGSVVYDEYPGVQYRQHGSNLIGVPTSLVSEINRRLKRFFRSDGGVFRLSDQVKEFLAAFGDRIPEDQRQVLNLAISGKSIFNDRIRLAKTRKIWRQRKIDDWMTRILIIMNHY